MATPTFTGREVVKALTKHRYFVTGRTGSHVQLRYEHPSNTRDIRRVTVPLNGELPTGTLRSIAEQCEANDFQAWCDWIERSI